MARYQLTGDHDADMRHYQKKLIPLNIFVCILCITSIITMMFVPFFKISVSKILGSKEVKTYVTDTLNKEIGKNSASYDGNWAFTVASDSNGSSGSSGSSGSNTDFDEIVSSVLSSAIDPILTELGKGKLEFKLTAFSSLKVLIGGGEAFKKEIAALIGDFSDNLVKTLEAMLDDGKLVDTIVQDAMPTVIRTSIDTLKGPDSDLPQEAKDKLNALTPEEIDDIVELAQGLNDKTTPDGFVDNLCEAAPDLLLALTGEEPSDEDIANLRADIEKELDARLAKVDPARRAELESGDFSLETFICLMFSDTLDDVLNKSDKNNTTASAVAATSDDSELDIPTGNENNKVYTSFSEILGDMNDSENGIDVKAEVQKIIDEALSGVGDGLDTIAQIYGYIFLFFAFFMLMWFILFLFAFFHTFAKNKRFCMWYVKLLCWIPGLIWLVLLLASFGPVLTALTGLIGTELPVGLLKAVFGGMSSWGTGISYICYWVLWIVSIFWAFPIKRKIRKIKKLQKSEG